MRYAGQGFEIHVDLAVRPDRRELRWQGDRSLQGGLSAQEQVSRPGGHDRSGGLDAGCNAAIARWLGRHRAGRGRGPRRARGRQRRHGSRRRAATPTHGSSTAARLRTARPSPGPAIVEDPDCTAVILPGDTARLSAAGAHHHRHRWRRHAHEGRRRGRSHHAHRDLELADLDRRRARLHPAPHRLLGGRARGRRLLHSPVRPQRGDDRAGQLQPGASGLHAGDGQARAALLSRPRR